MTSGGNSDNCVLDGCQENTTLVCLNGVVYENIRLVYLNSVFKL